jgi:hypothetical protein
MSGVVITPRARADLKAIWAYTADRWNIEQADRYVTMLHSATICNVGLTTSISNRYIGSLLDDRDAKPAVLGGYSRGKARDACSNDDHIVASEHLTFALTQEHTFLYFK